MKRQWLGVMAAWMLSCGMMLSGAVLDFQLQRQSTQAVSNEWTQHAYNAQNTNYQPEAVEMPWRWKWSWNGPNASGGVASGHHRLPRNVQPITGGGYCYIADGDNGCRVLSIANGAVVRTISPGGSINATPAYDPADGMLYLPSTNGTLYKVNPVTGNTVGTYNAGSAIEYAPCLIGDRVFITAGNTVRAVRKSDMTLIWSYNAGSPVETPAAYSASRDVVVVLSQNLNVHCIKNGDGTAKWPPFKPTARTYQTGNNIAPDRAEARWGWPVIAEEHGYVLVKYRLDWDTLYGAWSPWPTDNATIRSNLTSRPDQQCMFAIDLDDGSVPFICNLGHGGWGDGGFMPMGPMPIVKRFPNGDEVVYAVVRGHVMYDGRWDSHPGEMLLDNTTVSGYQAGYIRYIQNLYQGGATSNTQFYLTDEQPFCSMAGDYWFGNHWECSQDCVKITDRSASRGSWNNKILTIQGPNVVTSHDGGGTFSSTHYRADGLYNTRGYAAGFYIYWNQGAFYDNYWSEYACTVVSTGHLFVRSCDSAIVCLEPGNPLAMADELTTWELADAGTSDPDMEALNVGVRDRPASGPAVISYVDADKYLGQTKTVRGVLQEVFNNGKAVYLGFAKPHNGVFVARIMKEHWWKWGGRPEALYAPGQTVQITGKIVKYQNDPVIYVTHPSQVENVVEIVLVPPEETVLVYPVSAAFAGVKTWISGGK